ncbi:MAG: hypothetical protein JO090_14260 [Rhizobacter sp.]|nr:hypothetical protein [Rhizobacter sp.]
MPTPGPPCSGRWVFEGAYTDFLGDQRELGVRHLASLGVAIELDSIASYLRFSGWRALVRQKFANTCTAWRSGSP